MNKIIFLFDSFLAGGAETSILEIAKRLRSFKVLVVVLFADRDDLRKHFIASGIEVHDLFLRRDSIGWFIEGRKKFGKLCHEFEPSIVHAHLFKSELIARTCSLPPSTALIGAFVNDSYSPKRYRSQSFIRNVKLNFVRWLDRLTVRRNFRITSISRTISESNARILNYPFDRVKLIYRGRKTEKPYPYPHEQATAHLDKPYTFLVVSRLLIRKGYFDLIDAIALLNQRKINFKIQAAGEGVDRSAITSNAESRGISGIIDFLGYRDDVQALLRHADCFIFPSHYEGQGGSLVEAMLAAKPIIVSDIEVFREQVTERETGIFFQVGNSKDLSDKMLWMMENRLEAVRMGGKAREVAERKFDIEKIAEQHEQFYQDVIIEYARALQASSSSSSEI